ncbi:hypothetical protein [Tateyamaria sp.]|uniref:hypothetical protein n=1 Tax=Tateyamaria sp. TaxID=1929288 RepID=UPI003B228142
MDEAQATMAHYLTMEPTRTIQTWKKTNNYGGSEGGKRLLAGMRKAGMPLE